MIKIVENLLKPQEADYVADFFINNPEEKNPYFFIEYSDPLAFKLLNIAKDYYDISSIIGYERWAQVNVSVDWHYDNDWFLYEQTGLSRFPQCIMLYYPRVHITRGGAFLAEGGIKIEPKTNMAIILPPNIKHKSEPFEGKERLAVGFNPWNHMITPPTGQNPMSLIPPIYRKQQNIPPPQNPRDIFGV